MMRKNREIKVIFVILAVFFLAFLCVPMLRILMQSFTAAAWKDSRLRITRLY